MIRAVVAVSIMLTLIAGCGGTQDVAPEGQPWLGEGPPKTNSPPSLSGLPEGDIAVVFGEKTILTLHGQDPDGDDVSIQLASSPDWVTFSQGELILHPDTLKEGEVSFVVSDGVNTVTLPSKAIKVAAPPYIGYYPALSGGAEPGDTFKIIFSSKDGSVSTYETVVAQEGEDQAPVLLPYPYDEDGLAGAVAITEWARPGLSTFRRIVGPVSSLYTNLGERLSQPEITRTLHAPTAMSTAHVHLLSNRLDDGIGVSRFTLSNVNDAAASITAESMTYLASLYTLSRENDALKGLSLVLTANGDERNSGYANSSSLISEVNALRRQEGVLINDRYWQDLLNATAASFVSTPLTVWNEGGYQVLKPVDATFGGGLGFSLFLDKDGTYSTSSFENDAHDELSGQWTVEGSDLLLELGAVDDENRQVSIPYTNDPILLREQFQSALGVSFDVANKWSALALLSPSEHFTFTIKTPDRLKIRTVMSVFDDSMVYIESTGKVVFDLVTDSASYSIGKESRLVRRLVGNGSTAFEHQNQIFDLVMPWPSTEVGSVSTLEFGWIDLYDAPIARERRATSSGDKAVYLGWSGEYDSKIRAFTFTNESHPAGERIYRVSITDAPVETLQGGVSISSRRYGAQAELWVNGILLDRGPVPVYQVPKSRCEANGSCTVEAILKTGVLWRDAGFGREGVDMLVAQDVSTLVPGETLETVERFLFPVTYGDNCVGEVARCLVPSAPPFTLSAIDDTPWVAKSQGSSVYLQPIHVSDDRAAWRNDAGRVFDYSSTALGADDLAWLCSYVNLAVKTVMSDGTEQERQALASRCVTPD